MLCATSRVACTYLLPSARVADTKHGEMERKRQLAEHDDCKAVVNKTCG